MIIVTGSVEIRPEGLYEALEESLAHVHRSRAEPGCISHAVHRDGENSSWLFFFEQWQDMEALQTHFQVPESGAFVAALTRLAVAPPVLKIFDATQIS